MKFLLFILVFQVISSTLVFANFTFSAYSQNQFIDDELSLVTYLQFDAKSLFYYQQGTLCAANIIYEIQIQNKRNVLVYQGSFLIKPQYQNNSTLIEKVAVALSPGEYFVTIVVTEKITENTQSAQYSTTVKENTGYVQLSDITIQSLKPSLKEFSFALKSTTVQPIIIQTGLYRQETSRPQAYIQKFILEYQKEYSATTKSGVNQYSQLVNTEGLPPGDYELQILILDVQENVLEISKANVLINWENIEKIHNNTKELLDGMWFIEGFRTVVQPLLNPNDSTQLVQSIMRFWNGLQTNTEQSNRTTYKEANTQEFERYFATVTAFKQQYGYDSRTALALSFGKPDAVVQNSDREQTWHYKRLRLKFRLLKKEESWVLA